MPKIKVHIYFIVEKPLSKRSGIGGPNVSGNIDIPAIEVKSEGKHGIMYCSPSVHKNGHPYQIIGTTIPTILDKEQSEDLENSINEIYEKYGITVSSNNKTPIHELFNPDFKIRAGNNKSGALMRVMESLISRNRNILTEGQILALSQQWNQEHCEPPLDESKVNYQWECAKGFIQENITTNETNIQDKYDDVKPGEKSNLNIHHLLNSVKERWIEVFIDQFGKYYITIRVKDHIECIPLNSSRFKGIVRNEYFDKERKILSEDKLEGILKLLESELMFSEDLKKIELSLRVSAQKEEPNVFYYDLTNSQWEIVRISSKGWEIVKNNEYPTIQTI